MRPIPVVLALLAVVAALPPPAVEADSTTIRGYLPTGLGRASVVFDGTNAYVLGGWDCQPEYSSCNGVDAFKEDVYRYNPATGSLTTMGATLWFGNAGSAAVWAPELGKAILFGGFRCALPGLLQCDSALEIFTYDPATDSVQIVLGVLPTPRAYASAVWTEEVAYIFGGWDGGTADYDQILRYDPALDTVTPMTARIPVPIGEGRYSMSAVWDGQYAYLAGGITSNGLQNRILRYDPRDDVIEDVGVQLPAGLGRAASFWDGSRAYFVGGAITTSSLGSDLLLRFDPARGTIETMAARLPSPRESPVAFWDPTPRAVNGCYAGCAHVLGGMKNDQIVRYTLEPGPPTPNAEWGPGAGNGTITWTASPANSRAHAIDTYRLYRAVGFGPMSLRATLPGTQLSYLDSGLDVTKTYRYVLTAENVDGLGPISPQAILEPPEPPSAPRNFVVFQGSAPGQIGMRWEAPADDGGAPVESYTIERSPTPSGPYSPIASVAGSARTYTDTGLGNGATRWYRVYGVNVAGWGDVSAQLPGTTASPPQAPRNPSARPDVQDLDTIVFTWTLPQLNGGLPITSWRIYRAEGLGSPHFLAEIPRTSVTYRDGNLTTGVYSYAVSAVNAAGEGARSEEATSVAVDTG